MLPKDLQAIVTDLDNQLTDEALTGRDRDLLGAIRDCIVGSKPIPPDLQDQYVQYLANDQRQDRYGK